jgi:hypothetical protein
MPHNSFKTQHHCKQLLETKVELTRILLHGIYGLQRFMLTMNGKLMCMTFSFSL